MRPQVGQVINNKYRLIRLIGDGGMGSVYEARHEVLATTVALKFLHLELSRRQGLVQRFLQEARVSARIHSPHVVKVSDVDQTSAGLAFIVLEYLEGKTLQALYEELYRAGQRLSYTNALEYTLQMLDGVEAAHRAGIIHRDLKPDNVMITTGLRGEPVVKILDFGIAKLKVTGELDRGLTRPGVIMGTPEYMAPEQAYSADAVDSRADIFSLGVMIFEMLAGRRPVGGDDPHQIAAQYLSGQVSKLSELAPHVDPALAQAVHRAMSPMPKDRFSTLAELRAAIEPAALAARAPSARATPAGAGDAVEGAPSPSPVGVSPTAVSGPQAVLPHTPATNAPDAGWSAAPGRSPSDAAGQSPPAEPAGYRAVPKTLPPEDEDPSAARGDAAVGTPAGGFSVHDRTIRATPVPPEVLAAVAQSRAESQSQDRARTSGDVASSPVMPRTVSSAPIPLGQGFGAGVHASPNGTASSAVAGMMSPAAGVLPTTASYTPEAAPRPGGTYVGEVGPQNGTHGFVPGTANMDHGFIGVAPAHAADHAAPQPRARKKKPPSLLFILMLATAVSAAVVGGLYAANKYAKTEDAQDDPVVAPLPTPAVPAATVPSEPTITAAPPPPPPPPPPVKTAPRPTATTKPPATTTPSTTPSATGRPPFSLPPLIIPSSFPPLFPAPPPNAPAPGTAAPPAQPPPPSTSPPSTPPPAGSGRPRIRIPGLGGRVDDRGSERQRGGTPVRRERPRIIVPR